MTTERLNILAAAAALREFTVPELIAYTGANQNTVRQVLHRERDKRGPFQRVGRVRGTGEQEEVWRLKDVDAAMDEIARESAVDDLRRPMSVGGEHVGATTRSFDRTEALLASAEDAVALSYQINDRAEQKALADIAINFLYAADPDPAGAEVEGAHESWWERTSDVSPMRSPVTRMPLAGLSSVTGMHTYSVRSNHETAFYRAQRVAAFASIAARRAESLPVNAEQLKIAAEAVSSPGEELSLEEATAWVRRIVRASLDTTIPLPPIAVFAPTEQSPSDLFPVISIEWRRVSAAVEEAHSTYTLWVQDWAESLLMSGLIPGLVISHNETPEANEILDEVLENTESSIRGPAVVVASHTQDSRIVARVSLSGGIFYPMRETREGLAHTVSRSVERAMGTSPDPLSSQSAGHVPWLNRKHPRGPAAGFDALVAGRDAQVLNNLGTALGRDDDDSALTAAQEAVEMYRAVINVDFAEDLTGRPERIYRVPAGISNSPPPAGWYGKEKPGDYQPRDDGHMMDPQGYKRQPSPPSLSKDSAAYFESWSDDEGATGRAVRAEQLAAFYTAEYPKVVKLLRQIFGASMEEAEDAAQKAMMDFAQRCGSAGARIRNPAGYVRRAAAHFFVKERQRDLERLPHELRGGYLVADAQPDRELSALEDGQYVERLLEFVTPIQRDVLRLVMAGLSTREIAGELHKSDENVRQHLKNGRDRIKLHPDLARLTSRKTKKRDGQ